MGTTRDWLAHSGTFEILLDWAGLAPSDRSGDYNSGILARLMAVNHPINRGGKNVGSVGQILAVKELVEAELPTFNYVLLHIISMDIYRALRVKLDPYFKRMFPRTWLGDRIGLYPFFAAVIIHSQKIRTCSNMLLQPELPYNAYSYSIINGAKVMAEILKEYEIGEISELEVDV